MARPELLRIVNLVLGILLVLLLVASWRQSPAPPVHLADGAREIIAPRDSPAAPAAAEASAPASSPAAVPSTAPILTGPNGQRYQD